MAHADQNSTAAAACPACGSSRVAPGALGTARAGAASVATFTLHELEIDRWRFIAYYQDLQVSGAATLCVACGLIWLAVSPEAAQKQIRSYGSAALKARTLHAGEALPLPAAAPRPDSRLPLPSDRPGEEGESAGEGSPG